ncbi:MAG: carbohydrate ABC transporter permease [Firmicutes bacterium]|nr:carbohydrate ABC transporter permease [Bacillota bacterium]
MIIKRMTGEKVFDFFNITLMVLIALIMLYPFYYVIMSSLSNSNFLIGDKGLMLTPKGFTLASYKMVLNNPNILSGYSTTIIVVVIGTTLNVMMTALGAFVLTRKDLAVRRLLTYMIIFTMYFSGGLIPTYLVVYKYLRLGNTLWALMLPGLISTYNLIIMRTNFMQIPISLEESAKINGANEFVILFKIFIPLSLPIMAVMVIFYGVGHWNSWFSAIIYIRDRSKYPLQLILREILLLNDVQGMMSEGAGTDAYNIGEGIKYATIIVATLPILCVYPFVQKYFVKGMMIGAVKG